MDPLHKLEGKCRRKLPKMSKKKGPISFIVQHLVLRDSRAAALNGIDLCEKM